MITPEVFELECCTITQILDHENLILMDYTTVQKNVVEIDTNRTEILLRWMYSLLLSHFLS